MNPFKPDYRYHSLADIPIEEFAARGKRGALLDIDNTLVPYGRYDSIPPRNMAWLQRAEACGVKCLLYSNATQWKIDQLGKLTGLPGAPKVYKPAWALLPKALEIIGCTKSEVVMVGDQICTDTLGGNFAGVDTILVEPLTEQDWPGTRILRMIEWIVLPDRRPWVRKRRT